MDSLFNPRLEDVTLIKEFLRKKLREDKGKELFIRNIKSITIPQQRNSYDCGLYLLRSIEVFLKRRNRVIELIKVTMYTKLQQTLFLLIGSFF
jgi:Ulp1 family protease